MKIILVLISLNIAFSQIPDSERQEFFIHFSYYPPYPPLITFTITIETITQLYCKEENSSSNLYLCEQCNNASSVILDNTQLGKHTSGWNICYQTLSPDFPYFGYGIYRITNSLNNKSFYIDFRDCNYGGTLFGYSGTDIAIIFDYQNNRFLWSIQGGQQNIIEQNQMLKIWEMYNIQNPNVQCFANFWYNCLVLIPDELGYAKLMWFPFPTPQSLVLNGFKVFRKINNGSFVNISTINNPQATSFVDNEIMLSYLMQNDVVYYYIVAFFTNNTESLPSNIVQGNIGGYGFGKKYNKSDKIKYELEIVQNYPNPFNPKTSIRYSVVSKEKVTLKVYDILGNEVATLVDGIKEAGNYEVEFNVSQFGNRRTDGYTRDNLSSGVYLARLTAGNFTKTIKMVLVK